MGMCQFGSLSEQQKYQQCAEQEGATQFGKPSRFKSTDGEFGLIHSSDGNLVISTTATIFLDYSQVMPV